MYVCVHTEGLAIEQCCQREYTSVIMANEEKREETYASGVLSEDDGVRKAL